MEYFENPNKNTRIWHYNMLKMAWHQPQTSLVTLRQLSCILLLTKNATCNVWNLIYKIQAIGRCNFFNYSPEIYHNLHAIYYYIVNRWEFCVCSVIHCWYHAKLATCRHTIIWVLREVMERCYSMGSISSFGIVSKICFTWQIIFTAIRRNIAIRLSTHDS